MICSDMPMLGSSLVIMNCLPSSLSATDVAYVIARYRQVHDFWHVLCDLPPTVLGEIALKWFEWAEVSISTLQCHSTHSV